MLLSAYNLPHILKSVFLIFRWYRRNRTFSTTIYLYQQICIYVCVLLITSCKRLPPNSQLHFSDLISLLSSNHFTEPSRLIGISTLAPELYSSTVDNLPSSDLSIFLTSSIGSHLTFFFKSK